MNEYQRQLKALLARSCPICGGSGECNDAEANSMYFNTWPCVNCKASGMELDKNKVKQRLASADLYPCMECGDLRTKAEGGTTFTVCDKCWYSYHGRAEQR